MYEPIIVHRGRTVSISFALGYDVSEDEITCDIRADTGSSPVIASWVVTFLTDGTDGELVLTLDDSVTSDIPMANRNAWMDLKRVVSGEPVSVIDKPIPVVFTGVVTV